METTDKRQNKESSQSKEARHSLTLWLENYFFFIFITYRISNVNNSGTKQVSIMKQIAF
jgi:hypothetical protein